MSFDIVIQELNKNSKEDSREAVRLLAKIAENIINSPHNLKFRTLQKSNVTISKKILTISGGLLCLKLMGFIETDTSFILPPDAKLTSLVETKDTLLLWKESLDFETTNGDNTKPSTSESKEIKTDKLSIDSSKTNTSSEENKKLINQRHPNIKAVVLPPLAYQFGIPFLRKIEFHFHQCLQYGCKELQARAKNVIPIATLEIGAQKRLRAIQEHVKKNKLQDPNLDIQDLLLLELLQWFKEDFFTWVDSPECSYCNSKTHFSHMSTDKRLLIYTDRVEMHRCENCHKFTPFARYNDLNILLETRRGRCGEWANTFTLLCYAMGWDARFVVDEGDHVWTEVYSVAQKRWLHCDPCENICDRPLVYESGWKKNITYVIAYSIEEVQDVTWRYTSHHKEVLKKRTQCTEDQLINALLELRKIRQKEFSDAKKSYLIKRLLMELVELMMEKKPDDKDMMGRQSGDVAWRLARGETQDEDSSSYVWKINSDEINKNLITMRYAASKDVYELLVNGEVKCKVNKWNSGSSTHKNILRKEEKDWKMVYLARKDGDSEGIISWTFEINGAKLLDSVMINFQHSTFESGIVGAKICSGDICEIIPSNVKMLTTKNFAGKTNITVTATLSGGKGDVAWQHAQLFRQSLDSDDYPFTIAFAFK